MALNVKTSFNAQTGIARIDFFDNGTPITHFEFDRATNHVTSPARGQQVDPPGAWAGTKAVINWVRDVDRQVGAVEGIREPFKIELEVDASGVSLIIQVDAIIIDMSWLKATDEVTVAARGAIDIPWSDFLIYRDGLKRFVEEVERHKRENP